MKTRLFWIGSSAAVVVALAVLGWRGAANHSDRRVDAAKRGSVREAARSPIDATTPVDVAAGLPFGPGVDPKSFAVRGRFSDTSGKAYSVGQVRRNDRAAECVALLAPAGDTTSACDEPQLFSRGPVMWIEGFEGGPAPRDRTSEYLAGIAAPAVKGVDVVESNGESHSALFSAGNAFFFTLAPEDLARGIYIDHLSAFGADGHLLQRIAMNDAR